MVYAVNNRPQKVRAPELEHKSSKTEIKQPSLTAEDSEEEKRKKLRMQQQLAFQKEASRRMSTLPAAAAVAASIEPSTSAKSLQHTSSNNNLTAKIAASASQAPSISINKGDFEKDNANRLARLSRYGAMTLATPTPGFAIKTKRNTGTKVFINICSHPSVPFKPEPNRYELMHFLMTYIANY
jgi:preprotein translocase subunit SecD